MGRLERCSRREAAQPCTRRRRTEQGVELARAGPKAEQGQPPCRQRSQAALGGQRLEAVLRIQLRTFPSAQAELSSPAPDNDQAESKQREFACLEQKLAQMAQERSSALWEASQLQKQLGCTEREVEERAAQQDSGTLSIEPVGSITSPKQNELREQLGQWKSNILADLGTSTSNVSNSATVAPAPRITPALVSEWWRNHLGNQHSRSTVDGICEPDGHLRWFCASVDGGRLRNS